MRLRMLVKRMANAVPVPATAMDYLLFRSGRLRQPPALPAGAEALVRRVREEGYTVVEGYFSPQACDRCIEDLERILRDQPQFVQRYSDLRVLGAEELSPAIGSFWGDPFLLAIANHYIARVTVNAFTMANKVEAKPGSRGSGEGWHKDSSFRQFKAFVYLNDVTEENGPLQVVARSHRLGGYVDDMRAGGLRFRHLRISDEQMAKVLARDPSRLRTLAAKRGSLILADTAVIHRGRPPIAGIRYALTNYYMEAAQIDAGTGKAWNPVDPSKPLRLAMAALSGRA
jgi:hypothetical protein